MSEKNKDTSQLRQDFISKRWVIIATARGKRPHAFAGEPASIKQPKKTCPFENPFSEREPIFVYWNNEKNKDWQTIVLPNRFPAVEKGICGDFEKTGIYTKTQGVGFHDLVISRSHDKFITDLSSREAESYLKAFRERYSQLAKEKCVEYILILHNHGRMAGASLRHLHSQIISLPLIPSHVKDSMERSKGYFDKNKKCAHCEVIEYETKDKKRIIYQNKSFVAFIPFASSIAFEIKILPKKHQDSFGAISDEDIKLFSDVLQKSLVKLKKGLNDPAFNFFIHSSPAKENYGSFHWHLDIFPKTSIWAGFEIGTGVDISAVLPEEAAKFLRGIKLT